MGFLSLELNLLMSEILRADLLSPCAGHGTLTNKKEIRVTEIVRVVCVRGMAQLLQISKTPVEAYRNP